MLSQAASTPSLAMPFTLPMKRKTRAVREEERTPPPTSLPLKYHTCWIPLDPRKGGEAETGDFLHIQQQGEQPWGEFAL